MPGTLQSLSLYTLAVPHSHTPTLHTHTRHKDVAAHIHIAVHDEPVLPERGQRLVPLPAQQSHQVILVRQLPNLLSQRGLCLGMLQDQSI